jgi:hypothetical protein
MSGKIESFRDLNVYKTAVELQQEIFELTKSSPRKNYTRSRTRLDALLAP